MFISVYPFRSTILDIWKFLNGESAKQSDLKFVGIEKLITRNFIFFYENLEKEFSTEQPDIRISGNEPECFFGDPIMKSDIFGSDIRKYPKKKFLCFVYLKM